MSNPSHLSAIFFDLDGTIRHNDPPAVDTFHEFAVELGVSTDEDLRRSAERWVSEYWAESKDLHQDVEEFGAWRDNPAFWANHARRHLEALGAPPIEAEKLASVITTMMTEMYQPVNVVPDDVIPTLTMFREEGYQLGLVSNRSEALDEVVLELGLEDAFDLTLAGGEVGFFKPDPRLLEHASVMADVAASNVAYVGDNYYADIVAAQGAGMVPVLLDPKGLFPEAGCQIIQNIGDLRSLFLNEN